MGSAPFAAARAPSADRHRGCPITLSTAAPGAAEVVKELLRQLVDARFVLTDRDGAVTRWSRPAEELFGWPGARMLGRRLEETLALAAELPLDGGRASDRRPAQGAATSSRSRSRSCPWA